MTRVEDGAYRNVAGGASQPVHITNGPDDLVQVNATVTVPPVTVAFGDPITGQSLEAGGDGNLGWLSSLRKAIVDRLGEVTASPASNTVLARLKAIADAVATGATETTLSALSAKLPATIGQQARAASLAVTLSTEDAAALATAAKQPALGTAGTSSADVLSVQGIAGATPVVVGGSVASEAADSGNPVKIGGVYSATPLALADGQRGNVQLDPYGLLRISGAAEGIALASAARTTTTSSADILTYGARAMIIFLNVTAASGTGGLTVGIQPKDPASGAYGFRINGVTAAKTTTGLFLMSYGLANSNVSSGLAAADIMGGPMPFRFRFQIVHADASNYTYSLAYSLCP